MRRFPRARSTRFYARDKFEVADRISVEAGLRLEKQTGASDVGASTVDATVIAPRLSGTYDISGEGKTLVTASYGRYYASIIQGFSDAFAQVAQQTNYNNNVWNGSAFVFSNRVQLSGSSFTPNLDLKPSHVDEATLGFQRQIGQRMGAGVRFIYRTWGDIIDDVRTFNAGQHDQSPGAELRRGGAHLQRASSSRGRSDSPTTGMRG